MLRNSSTGKMVMGKVRLADSAFARMKGLMFERKENFDYALVFELPHAGRMAASVHMMFVFFPIGIVFLDAGKKVVDIAALAPWMLNYTPKKAAKYFVELPEGKAEGVSIGDIINWK